MLRALAELGLWTLLLTYMKLLSFDMTVLMTMAWVRALAELGLHLTIALCMHSLVMPSSWAVTHNLYQTLG